MAERRILYLTVLAACLVFFWAYREWLSWLLLVVVAVLPWLSLLLSLRAMAKMRLRILCPERILKAQDASMTLVGSCELPSPAIRGKIRGTEYMSGATLTFRSGEHVPSGHCGAWRLEVIKSRVYDYLNLFSWRVRQHDDALVYIMPQQLPMATPPDLTKYLATAFKPKPGGGYAENHELRLYRPGDNLHQIHWKLTAKTGKLILREPMEPIKGKAVVSLELGGDREILDKKLGRLLWLSRYLLEQNVAHEIHCLSGDGMKVYPIPGYDRLDKAMRSILKLPLAGPEEKIDFIQASWKYHIGGDGLEA